MYVKLSKPRNATEQELFIIKALEQTHDGYGLSLTVINAKLVLNGFQEVEARTIRDINERYNNFKYLGMTPKGRIFKINRLYRLVDIDSKYAMRQHTKAYYLMLAAIQNFRNSSRVYGDVNVVNSMTIDELMEEYDAEAITE